MIPVEKNKQYTLEITDVTNDGNGVGKIDGYTIFVPAVVTGDVIQVLIVKVKSAYGYGKLLQIITPSPNRITPGCPASVRCGGCSFMHIKYDFQLELKKNFIIDSLTRIGGISDFEFEGISGMNEPFCYRNKMVFPVGSDKDNNPVFGFYANRSHDIITFETCLLGKPVCSQIASTITEFMKNYKLSVYNELTHKGLVRRIFIRTTKHDKIMVVISINGTSLPSASRLTDILTEKYPQISSVIININKEKNNLVLGSKNITVFGDNTLSDTLCQNEFSISPHSFFQVNPVQTELLYEKCLEYAGISESDKVMDIYCGIGTISLAAAKKAKSVIGVEIVPEAIEDAKRNALCNNIKNVSFYAASADKIVPELIKNGERPDIVILDPPRKGSDEETLSAIVQAMPKRISYVSCNPATLARDVKYLSENGYKLEKVTGVDMFPHTSHVECCAQLCRK